MIPVLVVGGGPTGLVAAALLAGYGVGCTVVERYREAYPLPRAVHLDDEVFRILRAVGVADGFAGISRAAAGMRLLDAGHRTMAEFRRDVTGPHGYPQANLFDQPDLERLLRDHLRRYETSDVDGAGVRVLSGAEVVRVEQDGAAARALVRDAGGGERWLAARVVLGCDGANSTVRESIGARLLELGFRERWLVVDVRCAAPLDVWGGVEQVCDPRRAATFMRVGAQRYRWEFRLADGETAADLATPDRLHGLLAPWTAGVAPDELRVLRHAEYTFTARIADRWRAGRVFLLGDAAHQTPPFIGQGLGAGLRDAANLSWKLALAHRAGWRDADGLLDTYQAEREPHARRMIRAAVLAGWVMTGGQDRAAAVRRIVLAGLCRLPGFTRVTQRTLSPRLDRGTLVRRARLLPTGLAGCLLPQPSVTVAGRRQRLDDVLGPGFAILTRRSADTDLTALARHLDARIVALGPAPTTPESALGPAATTPEEAGAGPRSPGGGGRAATDVVLEDVVLEDDGGLGRWLRRGRAAAVLVRPDRVVLAAARPGRRAARNLRRAVETRLPIRDG
jgi:3-(3-hydroxy-phenyl)propionate hydroxylase